MGGEGWGIGGEDWRVGDGGCKILVRICFVRPQLNLLWGLPRALLYSTSPILAETNILIPTLPTSPLPFSLPLSSHLSTTFSHQTDYEKHTSFPVLDQLPYFNVVPSLSRHRAKTNQESEQETNKACTHESCISPFPSTYLSIHVKYRTALHRTAPQCNASNATQ